MRAASAIAAASECVARSARVSREWGVMRVQSARMTAAAGEAIESTEGTNREATLIREAMTSETLHSTAHPRPRWSWRTER